ncbi:MAG: putative secreted protein [Clostridia bacterium]|nr:putative secreted protein [Clostridia bacterium]
MGLVLILISSLCFVASSYFGKVVTNTTEMTAIVTSFSRFVLGAIIMLVYMILAKKSFKPTKMRLIFARSIFNCIALILFSWALQYTTITNVNMLHMTYPVFVFLLVPFITKERNKKTTLGYLAIIMLGTYLVSNPSFTSINVGDIIALTSAVVAAAAVIFLKEASKYNEGYLIVFYVMLIGTFLNLPFAFRDLTVFDLHGLIPVILSAILGFLGQVFLTWGYGYVDSATGSMLSTSRIPLAAVIGYIFLSEPLNLRIIIGIILISASLIGISGFVDRKRKKAVLTEEGYL